MCNLEIFVKIQSLLWAMVCVQAEFEKTINFPKLFSRKLLKFLRGFLELLDFSLEENLFKGVLKVSPRKSSL